MIPDPRAARSLRFARTVDGYHPSSISLALRAPYGTRGVLSEFRAARARASYWFDKNLMDLIVIAWCPGPSAQLPGSFWLYLFTTRKERERRSDERSGARSPASAQALLCRLITYWPARSICISGAISRKFETRIARQALLC